MLLPASPLPPQGQVYGCLYYFPYENDRETLPQDPTLFFKPREDSPFAGGGGGGMGFTQAPPRGTQALPRGGPTQALQRGGATQAQRGTQALGRAAGGGGGEEEEDDEDGDALGWQTHPIFEAFWQGRLIPGARIDTLPFIESVRQKRTAQAKVRASGAGSMRWRQLCGSCSWLNGAARGRPALRHAP